MFRMARSRNVFPKWADDPMMHLYHSDPTLQCSLGSYSKRDMYLILGRLN